MRLKIIQCGEPVLREPARPLTIDEIKSDEIQRLIAVMRETMHDAPGVGLAAPQIGLPLQLAVIEDRADNISPDALKERERDVVPFHVIINPVIRNVGEETREFFEGCLSVNGFTAIVKRSYRVNVECLNEHGQPVTIDAAGWYARILQHEIDHLNATLYIDRMKTRSFMSQENFARYWKDEPISGVNRKLSLDQG